MGKYFYHYGIFLIVFFLFIINYQVETYLSGWDNLQTELNPFLGVKRALFSVWEEYQSFGLLAGMAHASDLIRAIFIWLLSFISPQNIIRYFYHFLMLFLGGLGTFKLFNSQPVNSLTEKQKNCHSEFISESQKEIPKQVRDDKQKAGATTNVAIKQLNNESIAFLGTLFYMLNLGTIQIFYLPFEPFSTFFAFLPWGIWSYLNITWNVERGTYKKNLIVFFLINLLGTPSFYTQQLFVVYILILFLITLGLIINNVLSSKFQVLSSKFHASRFTLYVSRFMFHISLIFLINSFWLLPQLYFLRTSSSVVYEAKANQLATEDVYYQNREKGVLKYFLRLEGFYYDLFDKNNQALFLPWKNHFKNFWPLQYFFASLMILGIIYSLKKKNYTFIFPFILIIIAFLNATWPITLLDQIIRSNKFLNQIFRSPFTKFIIPYSLLYSYFLFQGIIVMLNLFQHLITIKGIPKQVRDDQKTFFIFYFLFFIFIIVYSLPALAGNFLSNEMKVKIPKDYFELIDYFKNIDKNRRIALFPNYTFWGWFFHRWGYNGSGFLWYGIEQPIVSRTFDVWSDKSESYFWEIKGAVEAEDLNRFETVLDKYDIDYLIVDYSLLPVEGSMKGLNYDRLENIISSSSKIKIIKKWSNLALFEFKKTQKTKDFVAIKNNLLNVAPKIKLTDYDNAYLNLGDYINDKNTNPDIIIPFLDLITFTKLPQKNWQINEKNNFFEINFSYSDDLNQYSLSNFNENFSALIYKNEEVSSFSGKINYQLKENNLKIFIPKILIEKVDKNSLLKTDCFPKTQCFSFNFSYLPQKYSYLLKINTKNYSGRRLFFYVLDETKKQTFLEDRLKKDEEIYILPPKYNYGLGYFVAFHQQNYENFISKNKIESIEVYLFPYENLKSLSLLSPQLYLYSDRSENRINENINFDAKKINYFLYEVSLTQITNYQLPITLYLSQSYHPGWKAYIIKRRTWNLERIFPFIFGKELKNHVLVNNWANGWLVENSQSWLKMVKNGQSSSKLVKTSSNELQPVSTSFNKFQPISTNYNQPQRGLIITIIFLPQYLQFLGFGFLILALIYIVFFYKIKRYEKS